MPINVSTANAAPAMHTAAITRCLSEGRSNHVNSFSSGRVSMSNGIVQSMASHTHTYDTAQATAGKRAMSPCGFMPEATHAKAMTAPQAASRISHATPTPNGKRCAMPDQNPHSHRKAAFAPCAKAAKPPRSLASRGSYPPGTAAGGIASDAPGARQARFNSTACAPPQGREPPSTPGPGSDPESCARPASTAGTSLRRSPAPCTPSAPQSDPPLRISPAPCA